MTRNSSHATKRFSVLISLISGLFGGAGLVFLDERLPQLSDCVFGPAEFKSFGPFTRPEDVEFDYYNLLDVYDTRAAIDIYNTGPFSFHIRAVDRIGDEGETYLVPLENRKTIGNSEDGEERYRHLRVFGYGFALQPQSRDKPVTISYRQNHCIFLREKDGS